MTEPAADLPVVDIPGELAYAADVPVDLAVALAAFQAKAPAVTKGKTAKVDSKSGASYEYRYASLADVVEAAKPVMAECGLGFLTRPRRAEAGGWELVGVLFHTSGQAITGTLPLTGGDERALGSSLTYQRRYLFGCLTGLVTDEDDDGARATRHQAQVRAQLEQARGILARARRAENLENLRGLWVTADRDRLLDVTIPDEGRLGDLLKTIGDELADSPADEPTPAGDESPDPPASAAPPDQARADVARQAVRDKHRRRMFALFSKAGIDDDDAQRDYISRVLEVEVESRAALNTQQLRRVCDALAEQIGDEPA